MVYTHSNTPWLRGEDVINDLPKASTRPHTRRERIEGLGIKGLDVPTASSSSKNESKASSRVSKRRSIVSFITKSVDLQFAEKFGSARASASHSTQTPSPPSPPLPHMSPTLWRTSNPSASSLAAEPSVEDLSTYHANLARFKAERAQREAELGLSNYELCRAVELKVIERPPLHRELSRKTSGLSMSRGLRAYWGGGCSSEGKGIASVSRASTIADPYWDENGDKDAFKAWFDRLGSEKTHSTIREGQVI